MRAQVTSPTTGVLLNDEMDDFSQPGLPNAYKLAPSRANFIRPGKRPLSSMSPTVVLQNGTVRAVCGASGGPIIITATIQALMGVLMYGKSALDAVQDPRLHHQLLPDAVTADADLSGEVVAGLRKRGHQARGNGSRSPPRTPLPRLHRQRGSRCVSSAP